MLAPRGSPSKIVALIAAVCGLSNFLEGYSSSYPNTAADSFRNFINESYIARGKGPLSIWWYTWYWSLVLNIWFVGYFAGTVFTPFITDNYGRKNGLCLANSISLLGTVITAIGIYMGIPEMLLIGRTVAAVGSGLSFGSLILFIQETTPTNLRGTCSFLSEVSYIAVNVIGMGAGMDLLLGQHLFALIAVGAVPSILSILIVLPLKESPKFLLLNRKDRKAAIEALRFYQGNNGVSLDNEQQAADDAAMDEILKESPDAPGGKNEPVSLWKALLQVTKQPHLRKAVAIGTLSLQIIVGIWPIIYISTDLLEAHFDPNASQYSSFAFICANFVASIIGTCSVEKFGRRPMLICCGIANTLCLLAYIIFDRMTTAGSALYVDDQFKYGCIASLIAYGITYGAALGPIAFFITSELVPQHYRSLVQSIVFMVNTVINFIFSFITLPLYELIDVWAFIPLFIIPSTVAIIYLIKELPETKGREIHEIVEQLKRGSRHHHKKSGDGKKKKNRQREKGLEQGQRVSNGSVTSAASSTSSSSGNQLAAEKFPQILLGAAGHGKNSLIKTSAGGAAIVAAVTKMMRQQQQAAFGVSSITADVAANKNIGGPLTTVEEEADCELDKPE